MEERRSLHTLGWEPCEKKGKGRLISTKNQAGADVLDHAMLESLSLAPRGISWNRSRHKPQPSEGTVPTPKTGEGAKLCMGWAGFRLRGNAHLCKGTWDGDLEGTDLQ